MHIMATCSNILHTVKTWTNVQGYEQMSKCCRGWDYST